MGGVSVTPGGAASGQRGSAYERETVRRFRDAGWGALRLPSSGSATDRDLPDLFAGKPIQARRGQATDDVELFTNAMAVELKSGKADILYIDPEEVDALIRFCETWGCRAYLGVRSTQQATPTATFCIAPDDARRTDGGRYAVDVDGVAGVASVVVGDGEVDVQ